MLVEKETGDKLLVLQKPEHTEDMFSFQARVIMA